MVLVMASGLHMDEQSILDDYSRQGSTLTFEGICQVGHNIHLPCKRCDIMNIKVTFLYGMYL